MEKQRICKICNRCFANGKAMGGHMRSHLAKLPLPLPPKPVIFQRQQAHFPSSPLKYPSPSSSSSSSLGYPFNGNPLGSYRSINHDLPENDNVNPTGKRRLKRLRKSVEKVEESSPELVSSITSDSFDEEDVALCLLMLSKDKQKWIKQKCKYMEEECEAEVENEGEEAPVSQRTDGIIDRTHTDEKKLKLMVNQSGRIFLEEGDSFGVIPARSKQKYKCVTCKKGFRSYQALGGHKANHKKIKIQGNEEDEKQNSDRRIFKCPFCDKVFASGQALGGHKKVHFAYLGNAHNKMPVKYKASNENLFDLNLSSHEDDEEEEEEEVSQAEVSAISKTKVHHKRN